MSSLLPLPNPSPSRRPTTYLAPRSLRAALATTESQAMESAVRNELLTGLAIHAVRNVNRYRQAVQAAVSDSAYVAVAADTYFVELLEGQADELRRFRRGH